MKRLHIHVSVDDLEQSIRFYAALFAAKPTVSRPDYAKWMLDDPRMNFAISARGARPGVDHVGIEAENREELAEIHGRLREADRPIFEEGATTCCYARSEKAWVADPSGLSWETFLTTGQAASYGNAADPDPIRTVSGPIAASNCCTPANAAAACCRGG